MDCGGGTTDIGIYRVASTEPLRLGTEVHEAMGGCSTCVIKTCLAYK